MLLLVTAACLIGCNDQQTHQVDMNPPADPQAAERAPDEPLIIRATPRETSKPRLGEIRVEQPPAPGEDAAGVDAADQTVPLGGSNGSQEGTISELSVERDTVLTPPGTRAYTIAKGDNYWNIATRMLGDGQRWREIRELNPGVDPRKLRIGQVIIIPEK
jgi:nucleoid-associated protein YgaU